MQAVHASIARLPGIMAGTMHARAEQIALPRRNRHERVGRKTDRIESLPAHGGVPASGGGIAVALIEALFGDDEIPRLAKAGDLRAGDATGEILRHMRWLAIPSPKDPTSSSSCPTSRRQRRRASTAATTSRRPS